MEISMTTLWSCGRFVVAFVCLLGATWGCVTQTARGMSAATPINIGSRRELFVDRLLVDQLHNLRFKQGEPIPREPVLSVDRPWEGVWVFPSQGGMFHRNGYWHLYYSAMQSKQDVGDWVCYAR